MKFAFKGAVATAMFGVAASSFGWSVLTPGNFTLLDNSGPAFPVNLGTVVADKITNITGTDNTNTVIFTGFVESTVVEYDGFGHLAFGFYMHNDATSRDPIERITVKDFAGFSTTVANGDNTFTDPGTPHAYYATRTADGTSLGFNWVVGNADGEIFPGTEGCYVWIETDAVAFKDGELAAIDGGVGTTDTYAPAAVPEPATMAVLGIAAAAIMRRRRSK